MSDPATVVEEGLISLLARRIVREGPDGIHVEPDGQVLLEYYAHSVAHLFDGSK